MTVQEITDITPSEMEAIEKMRCRLKNDVDQEMYEDTWFYYRFLKARDFNLSQAEIMLRKHLQWRKAKKIDTIIEDYKPLEAIEKYMPFNIFAYDKEGSVCYYMPASKYDVKGLHNSAKSSDIDTYIIRALEIGEKRSKERLKNKKCRVPGYVLIYDLKNLAFATATDKKGIEDFIRTAKVIQDNYPERLKRVLVINASSFFTITFSILKKFLAPVVLKKIQVFGSDGWQEPLLKLIDADDLPAFLGGNKTDPDGDPYCKSIINFAGTVPESYYLKKNQTSLSRDPKSKKLVLPRATLTEINLEVVAPGSLLEWEFETKSKDVAFGLIFKDRSGCEEREIELVPLMRLDTEACSETGVYKCETPGTYTILFDNSYSWFRAKEIYYKASVVSPKELEARMDQ